MIPGIVAQASLGTGDGSIDNAATLSPSYAHKSLSFTDGDLTVTHTSATSEYQNCATLAAKTSGKWYVEVTLNNFGTTAGGYNVGICNYKSLLSDTFIGDSANGVVFAVSGSIVRNNSSVGSLGAPSPGDVIGIALDADAGTVRFNKNGGSWSGAIALSGGGPYQVCVSTFYQNASATVNFGASPFAYTPYTGHAAWTENAPLVARYWRLHVNRVAAGGSAWVGFAETQHRETVSGSNVATGGTASASTTQGGTSAANALDGNPATVWNSSAPPQQWWQYDYGSGITKQLVELLLTVRNDNANVHPKSFAFLASNDGTNFLPALGVGGETWTLGETKTYAFPNS